MLVQSIEIMFLRREFDPSKVGEHERERLTSIRFFGLLELFSVAAQPKLHLSFRSIILCTFVLALRFTVSLLLGFFPNLHSPFLAAKKNSKHVSLKTHTTVEEHENCKNYM